MATGIGSLHASETNVWLRAKSKAFNIDYFMISKTATASPVPTQALVPISSPTVNEGGAYADEAVEVPGTVQMGRVRRG